MLSLKTISVMGALLQQMPISIKWYGRRMQNVLRKVQRKNAVELFKQIDALNAAEDKQYAGADLEERGLESKEITTASIREQVEKLDAVIASADTGKKMIRKAGSLKKKLEEKQDKIADYEKQIGT